jgi:hypothetical protein
VGECRPWPQQFREKKVLCGLAAAAIVSPLREDNEDMLNIAQSTRAAFASSATVIPAGERKVLYLLASSSHCASSSILIQGHY